MNTMLRGAADTDTRPLTAAEAATLHGVGDADPLSVELTLWSRYVELGSVDTYAAALQTGKALNARRQRTVTLDPEGMPYQPLYVHPELAQAFMTAHLLRSGEPEPRVYRLVAALNWMGLAHDSVRANVASFMPAGERRRYPYRHRGWWHLSGEVARRLLLRSYVPVLTGMRGRRPSAADLAGQQALDGRVMSLPGRRPRRADLDVRATARLVRDYLATTEPTCLMATARDQGRPLVRRVRGNPMLTPDRVNVETEALLVHPQTLAAHAQRAYTRLDVPGEGWSEALMHRLLSRLAAVHDPDVSFCRAFSVLDDPGRRPRGPWFRVTCGWADVPRPAETVLATEFRDYERWVAERLRQVRMAELAREAELAMEYMVEEDAR